MTTTRKSIARNLDRAAARAEIIDRRPASGKQCWFLAGLMEQLGEEPSDYGYGPEHTTAVLTCKIASRMIDNCLRRIERQQQAA